MVEFEGPSLIRQQRWRCLGCKAKTVTVFDARVVPRHRYARMVIMTGLRRRQAGDTWDQAASACTADGQLDLSTLKRWCRRFELEEPAATTVPPPAALFPRPPVQVILSSPAGSRSREPSQEDQWARSPPQP